MSKAQLEAIRLQKLWTIIGAVVMSIALVVLTVGGLYWATGKIPITTLRWVAVLLFLFWPATVVITWLVATNSAKEHLRGFDRGLDGAERTIQSVGRGLSATASMVRATRSVPRSNDDLLPTVGSMKILDAGGVASEDIVDL